MAKAIRENGDGAAVTTLALPNGRSVVVHVRPIDADDTGDGASKVSFKDALDFAELAETIGGMADSLAAVFERSLPTKATVSFGVEVSGKAGKLLALLVDAEGKGTLNITLEWERPKVADPTTTGNGPPAGSASGTPSAAAPPTGNVSNAGNP